MWQNVFEIFFFLFLILDISIHHIGFLRYMFYESQVRSVVARFKPRAFSYAVAYSLNILISFVTFVNARDKSPFSFSPYPSLYSRDDEISGGGRGLSSDKHLLNFHDALRASFGGPRSSISRSWGPAIGEGTTRKKIVKPVVIKRRLRPLACLFSRSSLVFLKRQFSALRKMVVREVKDGVRR